MRKIFIEKAFCQGRYRSPEVKQLLPAIIFRFRMLFVENAFLAVGFYRLCEIPENALQTNDKRFYGTDVECFL